MGLVSRRRVGIVSGEAGEDSRKAQLPDPPADLRRHLRHVRREETAAHPKSHECSPLCLSLSAAAAGPSSANGGSDCPAPNSFLTHTRMNPSTWRNRWLPFSLSHGGI